MARIKFRGPLWLLFVLAALASQLAAAETVLEASSGNRFTFAGNRKLLQNIGSSGGSTVFGDPPEGTLVVTWNPIPSKSLADGSYGRLTDPPYQYDWFNIGSSSSCVNCSTLYFYPVDVYVAGPNGQKTQLIAANQTLTQVGPNGENTISIGGCDINKRVYSDPGELLGRTCLGAYNVPDNKTVDITQVWDLLQAPDDLEFSIPTPLNRIYCLAFFFGPSTSGKGETLTNFQASFDNGPIPVQPPTENSLVTGIFSNLAFFSQPFTDPGTLTFKSINMRVQYDPPVPLNHFDWNFLYSHCDFSNEQLTVQSVAPRKTLVPPSTECPSVNGFYTNSCFNKDGDMHVCCINPDSCGPYTDNGNPTCTNNQYYVFP